MFNWIKFLDNHRIPYATKGRNVSKGNASLKCPWCGEEDNSQHMNVSVKGYGYACWRNANHRGKNNAKLVQKLLRCTWAEAIKLVGGSTEVPTDEDFGERVRDKLNPDKAIEHGLQLPNDWRRLDTGKGIQRNLVFEYLRDRGYSGPTALRLATRYNIHYGTSSEWSRRVLWPLYDSSGILVNYTGRAISTHQTVRYKTLSGELAKARMSECLFDLATLDKTKADVLLVVEGPFDAMRLGWLGEPLGIYTTCVFTQNVSDTQEALLLGLSYKFKRHFVLFDQGADLQSFRAASRLGFERIKLPAGIKDPDTLSSGAALELLRQLTTVV